ncbi:uncharacterized protein LOC108672030 [Hyalella azteca]|uniref:Uncharacterized protein LOC108672030 n=1 Tax=Hyalella azteca TaxID=294128 RepID=A0A8B7NN79_HYAAZ|nr:uncharacterized protein LOC108672030 [Hyalella azteca]
MNCYTLVLLVSCVAAVSAAPFIDAAGCLVGPSGKVCSTGNVQFSDAGSPVPAAAPSFRAPVQQPSVSLAQHRAQQQHQLALLRHAATASFTGLVGPSGVIGPSGLVGPSGPLAFGR